MATLLSCRCRVADTYAHNRSGTEHIMLHLHEHSVSRIYAHAVSNARPVIHAHNVQTHNVVFPEPGIMPCPMLRTRRDTLFSKGSAQKSSFACRQSGSCMRVATRAATTPQASSGCCAESSRSTRKPIECTSWMNSARDHSSGAPPKSTSRATRSRPTGEGSRRARRQAA